MAYMTGTDKYFAMLDAVEKYWGEASDQWVEIAKYGIAAPDADKILRYAGVETVVNQKGQVVSYNLKVTGNIASEAEQAVNSNAPAVLRSFDMPANTGLETVTTATGETVKHMTFKGGLAKAGNFVFGKVAPAVGAVSTGITLGKTIDKLLYNANPNFWDEHGMSTLNPDKWGDIIGSDSAGAKFLNFMLGTSPSGDTQAYMDENALAYMALYLQNKNIFDPEQTVITPDDYIKENLPQYANARIYATTGDAIAMYSNGDTRTLLTYDNESEVYKGFTPWPGGEMAYYAWASLKSFNYSRNVDSTKHKAKSEKINDKNFYYGGNEYGIDIEGTIFSPELSVAPDADGMGVSRWAYIVLFGNKSTIGGVDGIGTQDGATTPNLDGADTVDTVLQKLKEQYPQLWTNAVTHDVVQPDNTVKTYTYVPVAMPTINDKGDPVSDASTQTNPLVQPSTATESLLDTVTQLIQKSPPTNPPETGTGNTPVIPPVTGSASSLYAIYNPTLEQINSFGAWLWSDNFVDQIKKLFNDPMQAIIGLHKVYATPVTGAVQSIKVGYLDSGVASATVSNQYTTIDCGTIKLSEKFYNVFDYSPYTEINLYLPFIGIVRLDVGDVMRASIHIVYHVDVLSGACLAEVKVIRDGSGGTLYQYSGNASVTLPISSGSYMGIVSSIAGIAGGIVGTIASGGAALPMIASAAGSALNARTRVEHSGSFSGNAGAMGGKIPYLIVSRPQTALAKDFDRYIGYPANFTSTIGSCKGYIKVVESHLEGINATNSELEEIDSILKDGVIV